MSAAATDLFRKAAPLFQTTLQTAMLSTDTSATLSTTLNLPTDTGVTITIDEFSSTGVTTPSLREVMTGVVSSSQVIDLIRGQDGTTAQSHASGAIVQMVFTAQANNDLMSALLTQHTQTGALQAASVTNAMLAGGITGANLADNTITATQIANATITATQVANNTLTSAQFANPVWQYLGYAQITSGLTTTSTSFVAMTGLTSTVTIPSGTTKAKITLWLPNVSLSLAAGNYYNLAIYKDGSPIQSLFSNENNVNYSMPMSLIAIDAPTSGSHTYAAYWATNSSSSTVTLSVGTGTSATLPANGPAFILVECC